MNVNTVYSYITISFTIALIATALLGFYVVAYFVLFGFVVVSMVGMFMIRRMDIIKEREKDDKLD